MMADEQTGGLVEVVELCRHSWWSGVRLPIGTMVVPSFFMAMAWGSSPPE